MRVGVDAFNLAADRRGMGRYVRAILSGFAASAGVEPVLIVRNRRDAPALRAAFPYEVVCASGVRSARVAAVWYPWNGMRFAPHAPSLVTIHDPFAFTFPARGFIARAREQRPILRAVRRANRIATVSRWSAGELARIFHLPVADITIAPNIVQPFWHPVQPPQRAPYVLFVAAADKRKNAALLFEAFDAVFGTVELVVAGTLSRADLQRFASMRAPHRLVETDDAGLRELYSGALAVAVPSIAEGFGLPAIEAMACGAPVLAADAAALPEACEGAALLLAPNDPAAWSDALRRISSDARLRAVLHARGLERIARMDADAPIRTLRESLQRLSEGAR